MSDETPDQARARRRRALLWVVPLLVLLIGGMVAVTLAVGGFAAQTMTGAQPLSRLLTL
ncbi:hypothetical protein GRS96_07170 [Rathayibacter sp. VKM Ac-2803]|uniref:hypothetical protein n=1 Tax=unclassified Rathayibacter TaxID=2609250 RepID=UPI0013575128|nr:MULTISPECIES: hypothetical protein [unclassified Rathayibacter]MWV49058.1 hypothetical protein [Rathayibacter sp. VKM Ac-2803]MWV58448.1 hypothetical protein [Rathayibacter sp. VKM Ac-2754]